jgi:uncharacterized protein YkwD
VDTTGRVLSMATVGLATVLVVALLLGNAAPPGQGPDRDAAATMVQLVNEARAEHDLAPLVSAVDVALVAEAWSAAMAEVGELEHNPSFAEQICCWASVAENVAWSEPHRVWRPGNRVDRVVLELHEALLDSPGHRANLLDPGVDQIGIGVHVHTDGSIWITQNFRRATG